MNTAKNVPNRLINEKSPYLLQHACNPVDWFPWGEEAFRKAGEENKPVFLSVGYSTCHWCHVMAHESFEDEQTAEILNENFVAIKVDKEERPDIDSVYMSFCQAFTGSGGWPMSVFMTPDQKPFFAGTYFPPVSRHGMKSFREILLAVAKMWKQDRDKLVWSASEMVGQLESGEQQEGEIGEELLKEAEAVFEKLFDPEYGGFGKAPKFPTPHNILFLLEYYRSYGSEKALQMAEKTLICMYRGGLFDHIGYGFSRYSTDRFFLVPHFEKMLYDNALLILAYARAAAVTGDSFYMQTAERTAEYVLREMTHPEGGFYCAQDADSEGEEGKYYVFTPDEVQKVLGKEEGRRFNEQYGITGRGNFEGKNIPNLLSGAKDRVPEEDIGKLYRYRKERISLNLDDKILTSWNSLMIAAMALLYRVTGRKTYLAAAQKAKAFIDRSLSDGERLFVSTRNGNTSGNGFLEDYAFHAFALLELYRAEWRADYLEGAVRICKKVLKDFWDEENGGFYLSGNENEKLVLTMKETYDGALPSGNSVMAYVLVRLSQLTEDPKLFEKMERQLKFMAAQARDYPSGHSFFLLALLAYFYPPEHIVAVLRDGEKPESLKGRVPGEADVIVLDHPTEEYRLLNGQTTFYVCRDHSCSPPVNDLYSDL